MNQLYDVIIVGGGPAGLSAAYSAWQNGAKKIVVIERDRELGGILQQCIHNGLGIHNFKEELTGPGYAGRCIDLIKDKKEVETIDSNIKAKFLLHIILVLTGYSFSFAQGKILLFLPLVYLDKSEKYNMNFPDRKVAHQEQ